MPIDFEPFIHPMDRQALNALKKIPMLDTILKKYMKTVDENLLHGINMVSMVKLGRNQLPEIYKMLQEICSSLKISEPEFYLQMNPIPNAYTSGDTRPFIVINTGIIDLLRPEELKAVIAHECGHILCHHVLYHTLANHLLILGTGFFSDLKDIVIAPLKWALLYWIRRSEFSADRVAAYVMNDSGIIVNTMLRLAGGKSEITHNVNIEEFLQQAIEYRKDIDESKFNKFLQAIAIKDQTHPFAAIRAIEVREWFEKMHDELQDCINDDNLYQNIVLK